MKEAISPKSLRSVAGLPVERKRAHLFGAPSVAEFQTAIKQHRRDKLGGARSVKSP